MRRRLAAAGLRAVDAADHDPNASTVREANFPRTEHFLAALLDVLVASSSILPGPLPPTSAGPVRRAPASRWPTPAGRTRATRHCSVRAPTSATSPGSPEPVSLRTHGLPYTVCCSWGTCVRFASWGYSGCGPHVVPARPTGGGAASWPTSDTRWWRCSCTPRSSGHAGSEAGCTSRSGRAASPACAWGTERSPPVRTAVRSRPARCSSRARRRGRFPAGVTTASAPLRLYLLYRAVLPQTRGAHEVLGWAHLNHARRIVTAAPGSLTTCHFGASGRVDHSTLRPATAQQ